MCSLRLVALSSAALLTLQPILAGQEAGSGKSKPEPKRPSLSLRAIPGSGMAPVRVFLTGELKGGDDDFEEYYCPTVEWDWNDGTISQTSSDCDPYEAGKSEIKRRFTTQHLFQRQGHFRVQLRLKKKDKPLTTATTVIQILGGAGQP